MYIAQMYCYGKDPLAVGVSGISGCMGVFAAFDNMLYAIHVPDNPTYNEQGGNDFVAFVKEQSDNFDPARAQLFFVLNATQRPGYREEVKNIAGKLRVTKPQVVRVNMAASRMPNPLAVVVLCERRGGSTLVLKYMADANVKWQDGGTPRSGYYRNASFTRAARTSGAIADGWLVVDAVNSSIMTMTVAPAI